MVPWHICSLYAIINIYVNHITQTFLLTIFSALTSAYDELKLFCFGKRAQNKQKKNLILIDAQY